MDNETRRAAVASSSSSFGNSTASETGGTLTDAERIRSLEMLVGQLRASNASAQLQFTRARELEAQLRLAQKRVAAAEESATQAHAHIAAMQRSSSWRLSSPIRAGGLALRKVTGKALGRDLAKRAVLHGAAFVRSRPALRENIATVLARFPSLRSRMIQLAGYNAIQGFTAGASLSAVDTVERLTARGLEVHADLTIARNASEK